MPLKLNISQKGKAYKLEIEHVALEGKLVGDIIQGKEIKPELEGYEFKITGGSDIAGFPMSKNIEGIALKKILLTRGFGMREKIKGLRKRKTARGKVITDKIALVNLNTLKEGKKPLAEIFPTSNKQSGKKEEIKAESE